MHSSSLPFARRSAILLGVLACSSALATSASALSVTTEDYFVQTSAQAFSGYHLSGTVNDSDSDIQTTLDTNDATISANTAGASSVLSGNVGGVANATARADLAAGTLKASSDASNDSTGINDNVSATSYSLARMGDTLEFTGVAGSAVDVTLDVDGTIMSDNNLTLPGASSQLQLFAYVAVYDAGASVDSSNWACFLSNSCVTGPLATDILSRDYSGHSGSIAETILETLTASFTLSGTSQMVKVFGHLSTLSSRGDDNAGDTALDFFNTATFGVSTATGVSYSSASGVFATGATPPAVPLPAAGLSLLAGLGALAGLHRRRRAA